METKWNEGGWDTQHSYAEILKKKNLSQWLFPQLYSQINGQSSSWGQEAMFGWEYKQPAFFNCHTTFPLHGIYNSLWPLHPCNSLRVTEILQCMSFHRPACLKILYHWYSLFHVLAVFFLCHDWGFPASPDQFVLGKRKIWIRKKNLGWLWK